MVMISDISEAVHGPMGHGQHRSVDYSDFQGEFGCSPSVEVRKLTGLVGCVVFVCSYSPLEPLEEE